MAPVLRLYVNGELVKSVSTRTRPPRRPASARCSRRQRRRRFFKGHIDEVRIYDRALDAGEIGADKVSPIETPPTGPVAAYSFDAGEGDPRRRPAGDHDGSSKTRDGTKANTAGRCTSTAKTTASPSPRSRICSSSKTRNSPSRPGCGRLGMATRIRSYRWKTKALPKGKRTSLTCVAEAEATKAWVRAKGGEAAPGLRDDRLPDALVPTAPCHLNGAEATSTSIGSSIALSRSDRQLCQRRSPSAAAGQRPPPAWLGLVATLVAVAVGTLLVYPLKDGGAGRLARGRLPAGDPADLDRVGIAARAVRLDRQRRRLQLLPDPAAASLHDRRGGELGRPGGVRDRGDRQQHRRRARAGPRCRSGAAPRGGRPRAGRAGGADPRAGPDAGGGGARPRRCGAATS